MQTVTQRTQTELARRGQDVLWTLTLQWADAEVRYSHREAAPSGAYPPATLLEPGRLSASIRNGLGPAPRSAASRLDLSLALDGPESPTIRERLAQADPEGLEATWGVVFLDDARQADLTDRVTLFHGTVESASVTRHALELHCIDYLSAKGRKIFGRELRPDELPEADSALEGRMLPWVFGALEEAELCEWRTGRSLLLAGDVRPDDKTIALQSVEGLPDTGVVQIGDERLEYDVLDRDTNQLGRETLPLRRSEPAYHDAGSPARLVPEAGFEWLAANHPCRAVENVRADGLAVPATDYAVAEENWNGTTIQKITLQKWPVQVAYENNRSALILNGQNQPGTWSLEPASTALDGNRALDSLPDETAAELNSAHSLLQARSTLPLSGGEKRHGLLESARLTIRVGADQRWEATTRLRLTFKKDATEISAVLQRPSAEMLQAIVPSHTHDSEGDPSGDLVANIAYGPVEFHLDLADPVAGDGAWDIFDGEGGSGFLAEVELETGGDPTRFFVWDLAFEAGYRARRGAAMAKRMTARIEGVESQSQLLEDPADIIRFFLTDSRALGLDPENLDLDSFTAASNRLEKLEYQFSNRLAAPRAIHTIFSRLLFESRCRLTTAGEIFSLHFEEGASPIQTEDFAFDADTILRSGALRLDRGDERSLLRTARLHYGRDFSGAESAMGWRRSFWSDAVVSRETYQDEGVDLTDRPHWHNHGRKHVIADLARSLLDRHGFRTERVEIAAPLSAAPLVKGDCVSLADAFFPLQLDQGRVESLALDEPHLLRVRARFAVAGPVCWTHDDRTFLRHRASGRLKEFWIEGSLVATLRWDGLLRLRGILVAHTTFYEIMSAPVQYNTSLQRLYFGTGSGGSYIPAFALDAAGDLYLAGDLKEETPRDDLVAADCLEATAQRLSIAIADASPVLVYEAAAAALELRGELAEESLES